MTYLLVGAFLIFAGRYSSKRLLEIHKQDKDFFDKEKINKLTIVLYILWAIASELYFIFGLYVLYGLWSAVGISIAASVVAVLIYTLIEQYYLSLKVIYNISYATIPIGTFLIYIGIVTNVN